MAQSPTYTRSTGFAADERANTGGRSTVRTDRLDAELDTLGATANTTRNNLELIQRDDGRLRDGVVVPGTLSAATVAFFGGSRFVPRGEWQPAMAYAVNDLPEVDGINYVALVAHTSGADFAVDLAAGKWQAMPGRQSAENTTFSPTADIASEDVQAAVQEVFAAARRQPLALVAYSYGAF